MAELADAHGSGPCEGNFMEVRILLSAPIKTQSFCSEFFLATTDAGKRESTTNRVWCVIWEIMNSQIAKKMILIWIFYCL